MSPLVYFVNSVDMTGCYDGGEEEIRSCGFAATPYFLLNNQHDTSSCRAKRSEVETSHAQFVGW
jgi:hypothetical protein